MCKTRAAHSKGRNEMMHGFGFGGFGWISMILNWIIIIGFIVGLVLLIVWLARKISPNGFMKGEMNDKEL